MLARFLTLLTIYLLPSTTLAEEEISYQSWKVGLCHEIVGTQPVVLGRRFLSEADFKEGAKVSSTEANYAGHTVLSFNGRNIENYDDLRLAYLGWFYGSDIGEPELVVRYQGLEKTVLEVGCIEAKTEAGETLSAEGWVDWIIFGMIENFAEFYYRGSDLFVPRYSDGTITIFEVNGEGEEDDAPIIRLYLLGPGKLASAHYFEGVALAKVSAYAKKEALDFQLQDGEQDFDKKLITYHDWDLEAGLRLNLRQFFRRVLNTQLKISEYELQIAKQARIGLRQKVEAEWEECKRTTSTEAEFNRCLGI